MSPTASSSLPVRRRRDGPTARSSDAQRHAAKDIQERRVANADALAINVKPEAHNSNGDDESADCFNDDEDDDLENEADYDSDDEVDRLFEFFDDIEDAADDGDDDRGDSKGTPEGTQTTDAGDDDEVDAADREHYLLLTGRLRRHYIKQLLADEADADGDADVTTYTKTVSTGVSKTGSMGRSAGGDAGGVPPLFTKIDQLRVRLGGVGK
jgi:hypothetical protein